MHSQQCVEKGLRALILERGERIPSRHDLIQLLNTATAEGWHLTLEVDDAVFLNQVYRGRYPTEEGLLPHGEPNQAEAQRAVRVAEQFLAEVTRVLE